MSIVRSKQKFSISSTTTRCSFRALYRRVRILAFLPSLSYQEEFQIHTVGPVLGPRNKSCCVIIFAAQSHLQTFCWHCQLGTGIYKRYVVECTLFVPFHNSRSAPVPTIQDAHTLCSCSSLKLSYSFTQQSYRKQQKGCLFFKSSFASI